jgi:hypothetical protein
VRLDAERRPERTHERHADAAELETFQLHAVPRTSFTG